MNPSPLTYNRKSLQRARELRRASTRAERLLWHRLRDNQLGTYFRRQAPFGKYTLDFVSIKARLVVEVDGFQHTTKKGQAHDRRRDAYLRYHGFRTLRFPNTVVLKEMESVIKIIQANVRLHSVPPLNSL